MRIRVLTVAVLICIAALCLGTKVRATVDIPFLYYYSEEQSAFIIERADGSDRHILASYTLSSKGLSPEVKPIVSGPGWSPSGKWFAWRETTAYGGTSAAQIVSRDGAKRLVALGGVPVADMRWSPADDILMLMVRANDAQPFVYDVYLVDMRSTPERTQLVLRDFAGSDRANNFLKWTPDGRYLVEYSSTDDHAGEMKMMNIAGTPETRRFYQVGENCFYPSWSGNGKVAYVESEGSQLIVEDFMNNAHAYFQRPSGIVRRLEWSPDARYLLIYTSDHCSQSDSTRVELSLLSVADQRRWLIDQDVQLPDANLRPFDEPIFSSWSPDSSHAAFLNRAEQIRIVAIPSLTVNQPLALGTGSTTSVRWSANHTLAFIWTDRHDNSRWMSDIYFYNTDENRLTRPLSSLEHPPSITSDYFAVSPDGTLLAFGGLYIFNIRTNRLTTITVSDARLNPSRDPLIGNIDRVFWHTSAPWLITASSDRPVLLNSVNADGSAQRELTLCSMSPSCFGWLPELATIF